jgi:hypothetical protein|tara:strand:+ start:391 stop:1110 length:720 start_codon:yes stop_codon:yes gene_type:complete
MDGFKTTRDAVLAQPVPQATNTYGPVAHETLFERVEAEIARNNWEVDDISYRGAMNNDVVIAYYTLATKSNLPVKPMIGIINSYNKTRRVGIACGARVMICMNGMISGEATAAKVHRSKVMDHLDQMINVTLGSLRKTFGEISNDITKFQEHKLDGMTEVSHMLGELYVRDSILTPTQASVVKSEITESIHFSMKEDTESFNSWNLYNNVTEALKRSHPLNEFKDYHKVHDYFKNYITI